MKVNTHRLTSTTSILAKGPVMTPSGLISAVTFLIVIPTALLIRLLTLLNLNAVVFYYPSGHSPHESGPLPSFDTNSTLEFELNDQTTDFLPLWLTHILQNHSLPQSMPQWEGQDAPVAVRIQLTVDFAQPPANPPFDQMITVNMTGPKLQNGSSQAISAPNTTAHFHGEAGFDDHEDHEPRTGTPFQPVAVDLLVLALGLVLFFFAARRQAPRLRSFYRSLLRMAKNSRVTTPLRRNEHTRAQEGARTPRYEDIVSEGMCLNLFLLAF